ncbi:MAG: GH25 family lysozyme [Kofleriaceae bacterium]
MSPAAGPPRRPRLALATSLLAAGLGGCVGADESLDLATIEQRATVCADGPTLLGVDVSKYQTNVNWAAAKADGVSFGFARVSDGTANVDAYFEANWAGMRANGIIRGAYQYFRPSVSVAAQAQLMLDKIGTLEPDDLSPVIDVETASGLSPGEVATKVGQWIEIVEAATGRRPIVYTGRYFWRDQVGGANFLPSPLWIAHYTSAECPTIPDPWSDWAFWQYTDSGSVDGIAGGVDVNVFNGSMADLLALTGGGGSATCGDGTCSAGESVDACPADCPPCGVIAATGGTIDDADACFLAGGPQQYIRVVDDAGQGGGLRWTHTTDGAAEANYGEWSLYFAEAGRYRVEAYTDLAYAESTQATYDIVHDGATSEVTLDQTAVDGWQLLGEFDFAAGAHDQLVHLADNTGEPGATETRLVLDAVRLTRLDAPIEDPDDEEEPGDDEPGDDDTGGCSAGGRSSGAGWLLVGGVALGMRRRRRCGERD